MDEFIIETRHLTKQYGTQKSVSDLNIHVKKAGSTVCSEETEPERQRP